MGKVRVYELAKEFGMESKELLKKLNDMGEFVRSASSTIEAPVVRRVREEIKGSGGDQKESRESTAPEIDPGAARVKTSTTPRTRAMSKSAAKKTATKATAKSAAAKTAAAKPGAAAAKAAAKPSPSTLAKSIPTIEDSALGTSVPKPSALAPKPRAPKATPGAPKPGARQVPKTVDEKPDRTAPRPSDIPKPGPRPGGQSRKQSGPRPGNNPFSSSQGMGATKRAPRPGEAAGTRRGGTARPGAPRPQGGGVPGMPRPNPAMMPKQQSTELRPVGRGGQQGRTGGRGRSGRGAGRPGGFHPGGFPGGPPPVGGSRGGRGRGTQGAFGRGTGKRSKSKRQRRQEFDEMKAPLVGGVRIKKGDGQTVRLRRGSSLADLAEKIGVDAAQLVQVLFGLGEMYTATQSVPDETLEILGTELNYDIEVVSPEDEDRELLESFDLEYGEDEGDEDDLERRPAVVTVMGHVDHGKTKLLDALRHTNVVEGEAGGITQAIGAYQVSAEVEGRDRKITFIDTPGHEAFTQMRARGAQATDIAVLVVAADDGVMPQTIEALNHAKAADVPVVVAVNKIDKPTADPDKVRGQLMEYGLVPEEYGGDTMFVEVSALKRTGIEDLLESIVLTADAELELLANPTMAAQGVSIEAHLDPGRGSTVTVLIQRGTLRRGDSIVCGSAYGRVRAMMNDHGEQVEEALPSMPVQVLGLTSVPGPGDSLLVVENDRIARQIADQREARMRAAAQAAMARPRTLEDLKKKLDEGEVTELNLILKGESAGSVEALEESLAKIDVGEEVTMRVIDRGVGGITETNVILAEASEAVIIGFNVRAQGKAKQLAEQANVDIRYYSVIYQAIDDIEAAMKGMLKPIYEEKTLGSAEIRQIFKSSKFGNIAGCMVESGIMRRNAKARLLRDGVVIADTSVASLRREKDDVTEVREGFECGMTLAQGSDIQVGDIIETYEMVEKPRD